MLDQQLQMIINETLPVYCVLKGHDPFGQITGHLENVADVPGCYQVVWQFGFGTFLCRFVKDHVKRISYYPAGLGAAVISLGPTDMDFGPEMEL